MKQKILDKSFRTLLVKLFTWQNSQLDNSLPIYSATGHSFTEVWSRAFLLTGYRNNLSYPWIAEFFVLYDYNSFCLQLPLSELSAENEQQAWRPNLNFDGELGWWIFLMIFLRCAAVVHGACLPVSKPTCRFFEVVAGAAVCGRGGALPREGQRRGRRWGWAWLGQSEHGASTHLFHFSF